MDITKMILEEYEKTKSTKEVAMCEKNLDKEEINLISILNCEQRKIFMDMRKCYFDLLMECEKEVINFTLTFIKTIFNK